MNSITPSPTKPVSFCVTLGRVHAMRLGGDARTVELAPAIGTATDRLERAAMARAEAVQARKAAGLVRADAANALVVQVHVAWRRVQSATEVAGTPDAYKAIFPEAMSPMLHGNAARRVPRIRGLVERLGATDAEASKALADALATFETAEAAFQETGRKAREATNTLHDARRAWHQAYRLSFMAVASRIGSAKAALAFFLPVAPRQTPPPVPDEGGEQAANPPPLPAPQTA
jgi:hypothetical protein